MPGQRAGAMSRERFGVEEPQEFPIWQDECSVCRVGPVEFRSIKAFVRSESDRIGRAQVESDGAGNERCTRCVEEKNSLDAVLSHYA